MSLGRGRVSAMGARRNEDAEIGVKGLHARTPRARQGQARSGFLPRGPVLTCPQVPACPEKVGAVVKGVKEMR